MKVIKRSGSEENLTKKKIFDSIEKANNCVIDEDKLSKKQIQRITDMVFNQCMDLDRPISVDELEDYIEKEIMANSGYEVAKQYITYRYKKILQKQRNTTDQAILSLIDENNEEAQAENANKDPYIIPTQRDYMAGETSKDLLRRYILPKDVIEAHDAGIIHFHDMDYGICHLHNCDLVNLDDMLQNGTVISGTKIEKPHTFSTACNITTQIIAQVACCQYGGQTFTMTHLAPFVEISRQKFRKELQDEFAYLGIEDEEKLNKLVEERVKDDIRKGIQTIQYQILTLMTTNGQAPFVTMNLYLGETDGEKTKADLALIIEEVLRQRIEGVKNPAGSWTAPTFPKIIYVLEPDNIREDSKYWYLTKLAADCVTKRMVPDFVSEKIMLKYKVDKNGEGHCYPPMGCRSFLQPYVENWIINENEEYAPGKKPIDLWNELIAKGEEVSGSKIVPKEPIYFDHLSVNNTICKFKVRLVEKCSSGAIRIHCALPRYYGRFNKGVVTINLADIALSSGKNQDKFWKIFDERLEICHKALRIRYDRLQGTKADVAPILWQYGAIARLKPGEKIDKLLVGGYSSISLGYVGLYECVKYMTGLSHTDDAAKDFGLKVMQHLNDACKNWDSTENIGYSVYGTPEEQTTYKFAKCLQRRFGIIEGITDKNYVTNSYHVPVFEEIDAFSKIYKEAAFQRLSPGGAITYIETPNMEKNPEAILEVMKYIYENIMYAEINTQLTWCQVCGGQGTVKMVKDEDGKLRWECANCGNHDHKKINAVVRLCGYLGNANVVNQGRMADIHDRVFHL